MKELNYLILSLIEIEISKYFPDFKIISYIVHRS